jgi:hypothetical protein
LANLLLFLCAEDKSMTPRVAIVIGIGIGMLTAWGPAPVRLSDLAAAQANPHEAHHPGTAATPDTAKVGPPANTMMGRMIASDTKLDELVKQMNEAKGQAKTDAIAAVVTALVEQHRAMRGMMADGMPMMKGNPNMMGRGAAPVQPEKK